MIFNKGSDPLIPIMKRKHLDQNRKILFECNDCASLLRATIPDDFNQTKVKITCHCGYKNLVHLNLRKHPRKDVNISGLLIDGTKQYFITIYDMSLYGIRCKFYKKNIKVGDILKIKYTLPDKQLTEIEEDIKVMHIITSGAFTECGCQVINADRHQEFSLNKKRKGFYILETDIKF